MVSALGTVPAGYVRAVEHITIANDGGRVLWVSDDLVPVGCSSKVEHSCLPVAVLLFSGGVVWHFGSANLGPEGSCWGTVSQGAVDGYTRAGVAYGYDLYGHFRPMRGEGGTEVVTSTFPWGTTQQATEIDTVAVATHLPTEGEVRISAGPGRAAFSYRWTDHWLSALMPVPHITACNG
jgi:hypothetical protein